MSKSLKELWGLIIYITNCTSNRG